MKEKIKIKTSDVKIKEEKTFDKQTLVIYRFDSEEKQLIKRLNMALTFLALIILILAILFAAGGILAISKYGSTIGGLIN